MSTKKNRFRLYIDDTGKVGDGAYVSVETAISAPMKTKWNTLTSPVCVGDVAETKEPIVKVYELPAKIKLKKGSAIDLRIHAAVEAADQIGVLLASGDINAAGADGGGHFTLEMNALASSWELALETTTTKTYDVVFEPHGENADVTLPEMAVSADNA